MDRNSAIGLTLIAALLMVYFFFFSPAPTPEVKKPVTTEQSQARKDSTSTPLNSAAPTDSASLKKYGDLSAFLGGSEELTNIENDVLRLTLSSTGSIREVELKKFKTYTQKPLLLADGKSNQFALTAGSIDLYKLKYSKEQVKKGDTTFVTYSASMTNGSYLKHIYSIPDQGYKIGYRIESDRVNFDSPTITFNWADQIPLQEKDINDSRNKTTINYYLSNGDFNSLSETSADSKVISEPLKWVSIRQKFFISSIISQSGFTNGSVATNFDPNDKTTVERADVSLSFPAENLKTKKANFNFYFGPNDYNILPDVTEGFSRNLNLGWPPLLWVNKFLIIPVFNFLQKFISNYGIIIMLLVLFVKLLLTPLSYKSYMGMAKMRLLKPELDAIKEKNGDNMAQAQQDQMKLYQQAGVNPFSGCIPLLLQMPILFAMFYFFPVSIELRQKPFLWAEDLSTYDSIINLPFTIPFGYGDHVSLFVLLMTASTIIYTWQNNQISSVQGPMKSMSYIMPVVFMFVLNSFSAGLSFYYFVSNLVTFAQQAIIKRFVDEDKIIALMEENKKKAATGTGTKSKFMTKLEEAMKASEEARKKGKK
jgi:YidC/Oxa1 family membrane protein insertase